jgi:hypothetical protein
MEQVRLAIEVILRKRVAFKEFHFTTDDGIKMTGKIRVGNVLYEFTAHDRHDRDITMLYFRDEWFSVRSESEDDVHVSHSVDGRPGWLIGSSFADVRIELIRSRR